MCAIVRFRRGASTGPFREALRPSGADRQGGRTNPPPPLTVRVMRNALTGRGLRLTLAVSSDAMYGRLDIRLAICLIWRRPVPRLLAATPACCEGVVCVLSVV